MFKRTEQLAKLIHEFPVTFKRTPRSSECVEFAFLPEMPNKKKGEKTVAKKKKKCMPKATFGKQVFVTVTGTLDVAEEDAFGKELLKASKSKKNYGLYVNSSEGEVPLTIESVKVDIEE